MRTRYAIYGILLIALFAFAIWQQARPTARQKDFLRTVRNVTPLEKLVVKPYPSSAAKWEIVVTNRAELTEVQNAFQQADLRKPSGHSGEIFEGEITLMNADNRAIKTRATVHKYEPTDLYLSPDLLQETKPGVFSATGIPDRIRVPKLGEWLMSKAKSENLKLQ